MENLNSINDATPALHPRRRKWLWAGLVAIAVLIAGFISYRYLTVKPANPSEVLAYTMDIDPETPDRYLQQLRAANLAILGRTDLVRKARLDSIWDKKADPSAVKTDIEFANWSDVLSEIAASKRVVMIAENHMSTVTRDWICKTLPVFHDEGFTHYCAEAICEPAFVLKFRGGPNHQTGFYTADPRFGCVIRRALSLDMAVAGYDFRPFGHDTREDYAADVIGKIAEKPNNRIVVHAGPGHVAKYLREDGTSWLASRFWEKSGIEPYTIFQITELHEPVTRDFLLDKIRLQFGDKYNQSDTFVWQPKLETIKEFRKANFDIPLVDMIVLHPPSTAEGPDTRLPTAVHKQQLIGTWTRKQWPVVISVYREGDSMDAIPLDQVLLEDGDSTFNLWVPKESEFILCAFGVHGQLEIDSEMQAGRWIVK